MSDPTRSADFPDDFAGFDSSDTEVLIVDGPGDTMVRPARPILRQLALAERERLARWQQMKTSDAEKPSDQNPVGS